MPLSVDEILNDINKVPDDTVLNFGDEKVRVGDLRTGYKALERVATENLQQRTTLEQTFAQQNQRSQQVEAEYNRMKGELEEARKQQQRPPQNSNEIQYDYSDPYSKGLTARMEAFLKDQAAEQKKQMDTFQQQIAQAAQGLTRLTLETKAQQDFSRYDWPEGYDAAKAFGEAQQRGFFDRTTQLPDLRMLNDVLMTPIRHKTEIEKAIEKAKAEGRAEAQAENMQRTRSKFNLVPNPSLRRQQSKGQKSSEQQPTDLSSWFNSDQSVPTEDETNLALKMVR
jgi:hypothetical protein